VQAASASPTHTHASSSLGQPSTTHTAPSLDSSWRSTAPSRKTPPLPPFAFLGLLSPPLAYLHSRTSTSHIPPHPKPLHQPPRPLPNSSTIPSHPIIPSHQPTRPLPLPHTPTPPFDPPSPFDPISPSSSHHIPLPGLPREFPREKTPLRLTFSEDARRTFLEIRGAASQGCSRGN
jgi:hypothetical protein